MGYDSVGITVAVRVSRHNSPRDDEHDALWDELRERIEQLAADPRYEPIMPMCC